jgi:hypothetical protein
MGQYFIADGRLYCRNQQGEIQEFESPFVQEKAERTNKHNTASGWKSQGSPGNPYWNSSVVWGNQAAGRSVSAFRFNHVVAASPNMLYYTLSNFGVTGLFEYDVKEQFETRLFHKNDFREEGFDYSSQRNEFVMAVWNDDGSCSLRILDNRGSGRTTLTEGDSRDSNPSFSHKNHQHILFQSAGIARNEEGGVFMYGPEAIHRLDMDKNEVFDILSNPQYDYVLPKEDTQGNIYCIRRPFHGPSTHTIFHTIKNIILFPIHFVVAIFNFLETFTRLFNQKAFKADGPNVQAPQNNKYVQIMGQTIDVAKNSKAYALNHEPSLVPANWELICLYPDGRQEVLARKAAYFDVDAAGNIVFTNGYRVRSLENVTQKVDFRHNLIQEVHIDF